MDASKSFLLNALLQKANEHWTQIPMPFLGVSSTSICIAFIGNVWLLYRGLSKKSLRNSTFHLILMNQSLVNLLLASFCYTSFLFKLREGISKNRLQVEHCMYFTLFLLILVETSLFTNGFVAVTRALSCHPLLPVSVALRSRRATFICIAVIWLLSVVLYFCVWVSEQECWARVYSCRTVTDILDDVLAGKNPVELKPVHSIVSWTLASTMIAIIVVNTASYAIIVKYLLKQRRLGHENGAISYQRQKEKKRALMVIVLLFLVLLVCWIPITCALLIDPLLLNEQYIFMVIPSFEAAIDPIVCMVTMPVFRPDWLSKVGRKTAPAQESQIPSVQGTVTTLNSNNP